MRNLVVMMIFGLLSLSSFANDKVDYVQVSLLKTADAFKSIHKDDLKIACTELALTKEVLIETLTKEGIETLGYSTDYQLITDVCDGKIKLKKKPYDELGSYLVEFANDPYLANYIK